MSDLIERNAVMLRVREFIGNPSYDELMLVNDLNELPSAEPEERTAKIIHSDVFGDWKNMCGNCFEAGKKMGLFHEQKYCYECGCKLDWSDDE